MRKKVIDNTDTSSMYPYYQTYILYQGLSECEVSLLNSLTSEESITYDNPYFMEQDFSPDNSLVEVFHAENLLDIGLIQECLCTEDAMRGHIRGVRGFTQTRGGMHFTKRIFNTLVTNDLSNYCILEMCRAERTISDIFIQRSTGEYMI